MMRSVTRCAWSENPEAGHNHLLGRALHFGWIGQPRSTRWLNSCHLRGTHHGLHRAVSALKGFGLSEPGKEKETGKPEKKWVRTVETWIVFVVAFLPVLALAFLLLGGEHNTAVAVPVALSLAVVAGVAAARSPKVRSGVISVLSFLQAS